MELIPYTPKARDEIEEQLSAEANKINIEERRNNGMTVIMFLLRKEKIITIYCADERTNSAAEFPISPDEAFEWFEHAFAHPDANLTTYTKAQNGDGYGA